MAVLSGAAALDTYLPFEGGPAYYRKWARTPLGNDDYFPISVWLQPAKSAAAYKAIGVNNFVGLWKGPTEEQLKLLQAAGMPVFAGQTAFGLSSPDNAVIRGWTQMDEPDNAQAKPGGGYGSCVLPPEIIARYQKFQAADASRPVLLNLGQGVVNETYVGRGSDCARHDEHYPEYAKGADILSYDVYPVNSKYPMWHTGAGVDRLRKWAGYKKPVWNWIETTSIHGGPKPTPAQIKSQVWMSLIHGSMGIGYFCHQFKPTQDESAPLHDPETRAAIAAINKQVTELARPLNTASIGNGVTVMSELPIDYMLKRVGGVTYLFAMGARPGGETTATFRLRDGGNVTATVLGESRSIAVKNGVFRDRFGEYEVHIYRLKQ